MKPRHTQSTRDRIAFWWRGKDLSALNGSGVFFIGFAKPPLRLALEALADHWLKYWQFYITAALGVAAIIWG